MTPTQRKPPHHTVAIVLLGVMLIGLGVLVRAGNHDTTRHTRASTAAPADMMSPSVVAAASATPFVAMDGKATPAADQQEREGTALPRDTTASAWIPSSVSSGHDLMFSPSPAAAPATRVAVTQTARPLPTAAPSAGEQASPTWRPKEPPEQLAQGPLATWLPNVEGESDGISNSGGGLTAVTTDAPPGGMTATATHRLAEMPTAAPVQTLAATQTPMPTAVITPSPLPTATPRPGPTPTYEYGTDTVRLEITKHETENLVYFAIEFWLTDIKQLRSAFSQGQFDAPTEPVKDIADRNGAVFAINGDFATFNNGGIIIRNGEVYRTNRSTRQLMVIDANGDFIAYPVPPENSEEVAEDFKAQGVWHTLVFGPVLIDQGEIQPLSKDFFLNLKALEPRTAIGQLGPLHYLVLVVDGRQKGYSKGATFADLQEMFVEYGAISAFNLDGGGSTTLYYRGEVLNQPANGDQRRVPDILYIAEE